MHEYTTLGRAVLKPCCVEWEKAHQWKTDWEEIGSAVHYDDYSPYCGTGRITGMATIGTYLEPVKYCPWCAGPKTKKVKVDRRRSVGKGAGLVQW